MRLRFATSPSQCALVLMLGLMELTTSCSCNPANPSAVTLRINNKTKDPIYVEGTNQKLGLSIKRTVNGEKFAFDDLACECRFCKNNCTTSCACPEPASLVRRIEAGKVADRLWSGVVQVSGSSTCSNGSSGGACLAQENAPLNEPFTVELCFSNQRPSGLVFGDGGVGNGALPANTRTCIEKEFRVQDGTVEIGPERGASCNTSAECKGAGELCFDAACTTGCPGNEFPELGSNWNLYVASIDNMGFFESEPRTPGKSFVGTGVISLVVFQGTSLQIGFTKTANAEVLTGKLTVQLPSGAGPTLSLNQKVTALVVDGVGDRPNRAFVLRDAETQAILFAGDMSDNGPLLSAVELAPLVVGADTTAIGCRQDSCGKLLYTKRLFGSGTTSISIEPGKQSQAQLNEGTYVFLNVSSGSYPSSTKCDAKDVKPYAVWRKQ
jgi:hypothetical protein